MEPVRCYMLLTASWTFWRRYSWRCHFHVHFDYLSQFRAIRSPLICIFTSTSSKCFQTLLSGCQVHVHLEKSLPRMQVIYEANFTTLLSIFLTFDQKGLNIEGTHCKNNFMRRKSKQLTTSCHNPLVILHGWYCILVFWHFQQQTWKFALSKLTSSEFGWKILSSATYHVLMEGWYCCLWCHRCLVVTICVVYGYKLRYCDVISQKFFKMEGETWCTDMQAFPVGPPTLFWENGPHEAFLFYLSRLHLHTVCFSFAFHCIVWTQWVNAWVE